MAARRPIPFMEINGSGSYQQQDTSKEELSSICGYARQRLWSHGDGALSLMPSDQLGDLRRRSCPKLQNAMTRKPHPGIPAQKTSKERIQLDFSNIPTSNTGQVCDI